MDQSQENMKILRVLPSTPTPIDSNPFSRFDTESERVQVQPESESLTSERNPSTSFANHDYEVATNTTINQEKNPPSNQTTEENLENLSKAEKRNRHESENTTEDNSNKPARKRKKIDAEIN